MEVYHTENEQVEALRRFLIKNGKFLLLLLLVVIVALAGWKYWQHQQQRTHRLTSEQFQKVWATLPASADANTALDLKQADAFIAANDNYYGAMTQLKTAALQAQKGDYAAAETTLRQALPRINHPALQALVNLRLARLQLQQHQPDQALQTLATINVKGWALTVADLRGDALLQKGDVKGAREAWRNGLALESAATSPLKDVLTMKLNNLPS